MNVDYNDYSVYCEFEENKFEYWTVEDSDYEIGEIYKISTGEYYFVCFQPWTNCFIYSKAIYKSLTKAKKALIDYVRDTGVLADCHLV